MKSRAHLNRTQKQDMLARFMQGNTAPIAHYKEEKEKPFAYIVEACQTFPAGRGVTDKRPEDVITEIEFSRSYYAGKPTETEMLPDMSRAEFNEWYAEIRSSGRPVVGMLGTRIVD